VVSHDPAAGDGRICELVGVYHARGDVRGELSYWVGARLGRAHCELCDITHGTFRRKSSWDACADALPVPFTTFHLNDRPPDVAAMTDGLTPCVVARSCDGELVMLLGAGDLAACRGEPGALMEAIDGAVDHAGLRWGDSWPEGL